MFTKEGVVFSTRNWLCSNAVENIAFELAFANLSIIFFRFITWLRKHMAQKNLHTCLTIPVSFDISTFFLEISTCYLEISTFYFELWKQCLAKNETMTIWNLRWKDLLDIVLTQHEIRIVLSRRFNCSISVRRLRHFLARLQLYRQQKYFTDFDEINDFVRNHLANLEQQHRYRFMHLKYITNGLVVS